jgi:hypothetical protein
MGYDLHITRKAFWAAPEGDQISLDEWNRYVAGDPDINPDAEFAGPHRFVVGSGSEGWTLHWRRGEIAVKNPSKAQIAKLVQIAKALGAKVRGDDNEVYGIDQNDPSIFRHEPSIFGQERLDASRDEKREKTAPKAITTGVHVVHRTFGRGIVLAVQGVGVNAIVQVVFESSGTKWLALSIAPLDILPT